MGEAGPGSTRLSAPSRARRQRLLAGPQGPGTGGRGWAQQEPGRGLSPHQPFHPAPLSSCKRTGAEHGRQENPQEPLREAAIRFIEEVNTMLAQLNMDNNIR
ncbi:hypothetical protein DUI87_30812 [Hirundo rustica rustica]|uniref:Uncharacterized protein n=1 Tax=Hirundo rustica rustica TaxID=333673 RepID=A0A3M0IWA2_HIRRU|nr:hypothetical protein DUI87_30812 [Hirundo rustica rustica]